MTEFGLVAVQVIFGVLMIVGGVLTIVGGLASVVLGAVAFGVFVAGVGAVVTLFTLREMRRGKEMNATRTGPERAIVLAKEEK